MTGKRAVLDTRGPFSAPLRSSARSPPPAGIRPRPTFARSRQDYCSDLYSASVRRATASHEYGPSAAARAAAASPERERLGRRSAP